MQSCGGIFHTKLSGLRDWIGETPCPMVSGQGNSPANEMELSGIWRNHRVQRAISVSLLAVALVAIIASASPRFHEIIHYNSGASNHSCAVTLFSSGSCDQTHSVEKVGHPHPGAVARALIFLPYQLIFAVLDFSRLEHAPPAFS